MLYKNIFDRVMSFFGLLFLSPFLLLIAIIIKVKMPDGPVLFKQNRVGKNGSIFKMFKFRTMTNTEHKSSISIKGESRITPLGAVLRKYKLDELPELFNVLVGDMSFVGPRPDVPGYADKLIGNDREILNLKPGITGPASLKYANEEELLAKVDNPISFNDKIIFPDKVRINNLYLQNWSFILDLKIIIHTILGKPYSDDNYFPKNSLK